MPRCAAALCAVIIAVNVLSCGPGEPRAGTVQDEAMRAGVTPEQLVLPTRRLLPRHGRQPRRRPAADVHAAGNRRPQHVDGLDRRRRSAVGPADRSTASARFDLLKTISSHPEQPNSTRTVTATGATIAGAISASSTSRASRRRPVPIPSHFGLWLDVRDPACPPDPFADASRYPGIKIGARGTTVPVGSYYGEPTGIVGLRLFPNPDFDEKARAALELRALLQRSDLLLRSQSRPALPRRHVVRVLSRRTEPDQAARRSREAEMGEAERERRRPVFLVGPRLQLARRQERDELLLPGAPCLAARDARHLARLDRQHQQPADDERGLQPAAAHARGEEVGQGDDGGRRA